MAMDRENFQKYLSERIPITGSAGMAFTVVRYDDEEVAVRAPLPENVNDKQTAFGGSIASLLTVAAWGMARAIAAAVDATPYIAIQQCKIEYLFPIAADFVAVARRPEGEAVSRFLDLYRRFGKGRIAVESEIVIDGQIAARFSGSFAALGEGSR